MKNVTEVKKAIEERTARSAWARGVKEYALELIDNLQESIDGGYTDPEDITNKSLLEKKLLNGADNWDQYSYGGCALIYNYEIAERLCTPSFVRARRDGEWNPSRFENWLDMQARALYQAARIIKNTAF